MKKAIITQSNYIPWKGYFDNINSVDLYIVFDDMQYTKRDWRNRNLIKTPNGSSWLTIPVEVKGKFFQKINETQVSDPNWGEKHWRTIQSNYSKAPFFKQYKDVFEELYRTELLNITDVNVLFIRKINEILGIKTEIIDSREFDLIDGKTERLVDLCVKNNVSHYFTGPAAKNYMIEEMFEEKNIDINYFDYSNYPEYPQLYNEFTHTVTILDMLFNLGEETINYMKSFDNK